MIKRVIRHIIFWAILWLWITVVWMDKECQFHNIAMATLLRLPWLVVAVYVNNYFLIPRYLIQKRQYFSYGALFLLLVAIHWLLDRLWMLLWVFDHYYQELGHSFYFFYYLPNLRNLFVFLSVFLLAAVLRFYRIWYENETATRKLAAEKMATELAFLKAQVNPHFLFNTLNNLYSLVVQRASDDLAEGIAQLSNLMRYLTYESNSERVPLQREVDQIHSFIAIQHLRISEDDDVLIGFKKQGQLEGKRIAPAILIPFVENALKHGIDVSKNSVVKMELSVEGNQLHFSTRNTCQTRTELQPEGVGLENVKKRLLLLYPDRHTLKIEKQGDLFIVNLSLELD
jgi:two-component system, LytTR family, sensor kinase